MIFHHDDSRARSGRILGQESGRFPGSCPPFGNGNSAHTHSAGERVGRGFKSHVIARLFLLLNRDSSFTFSRVSLWFIIILLVSNVAIAQRFNNRGQINNTGILRIHDTIAGVPATFNGTFELFGANQTLSAAQYQYVRLLGTGTKTTSGGNFSVQKNLTIGSSVTLNILKGNIVTLGDSLFENGVMNGAIQKTVNLSGGTTSSDFGQIGATVSWSSVAPGTTNIIRVSDSVQFGNGNESIRRYYEVQPTDATAVGSVMFKFSDSELNGHDVHNLQLWRSVDNGAHWQRHIPVVDTLLRTISKTNVQIKGIWTAGDTVRAIGPLQGGAGIPVSIALAGVQTVDPVILTTLDTIKIRVTDIFGSPVSGVSVSFTITTRPSVIAGGSLSDTNTVTNELGIASTVLTLGSKVGEYQMIATSPSLDTVRINTIAKHGVPQSLAKMTIVPESKPILAQLDSAFIVAVTDIGGNPIDSTWVKFTIDSIPSPFALDQDLSVDSMRTNSLGIAWTVLTLGEKVGTYGVSAKVDGIPDPVRFLATATVGIAAQIATIGATNINGIVGTAVDPLQVTLFDIGQNPVNNDTVRFKIVSFPQGSDTGSLSNSSVVTDALGKATSILTLGTKAGPYLVRAENTHVGTPATFTVNAHAAAPSSLAQLSGNGQIMPINSILANDFVVEVRDMYGNTVDSAIVVFTIDSLTANGAGADLSVDTMLSKANGQASTRLSLGYKTGSYKVNAAVNGIPAQIFTATASVGTAAAMVSVSGNGQSATIISALQNEFVLRINDMGGNGVPNVPVQFAFDTVPANATGQQLSVTSVSTSADGTVRTLLTLGNKVGTYRIRATSTGLRDTFFTASAMHGAAVAMIATAGQDQIKPILSSLDIPFTLRVLDIGDNAVPVQNIQFAITEKPAGDTSAVLSSTGGNTDSTGTSVTTLTLGSKVGTYTVKAIIPTATPVVKGKNRKNMTADVAGTAALEATFTALATNGTATVLAQLFGDRQVNPTETELDTAFVVSVRDRGDNAVPNDTVRFRIASAPANALQQALRDTVVVTNSNGIASTYLRMGTRAGTYTVEAAVNNVPAALFAANAYFIYGDLNKDIAINVADITSLVDFLNTKITLTASDSIKADFNHDNVIDTSDVGYIRDNILDRSLYANTLQPVIFTDGGDHSGYTKPIVKTKKGSFTQATSVFEATKYGLRFNVDNSIPIRGVELRLILKDSGAAIDKINMLMKRAETMNVFVSTKDHEVRVVAYNLSNIEIQPGNGSLFRLPSITSLEMIDSTEVVFALQSNSSVSSDVVKVTAPANAYPVTFRLSQNYPNPFNGSTTIEYDIPDGTLPTKTVIQVFNVLGQRIKTLVSEEHDPGRYSVRWDGTDQNGQLVSSGVYFYRLISKSHVGSRKMLYVK